MVDQTTVKPRADGAGNGAQPFPPRAVARNMADLGHDVTTLAELQAQLLMADSRAAVRRVTGPTVIAAGAAVLALASVPILLMAIAFAFEAGTGWPTWACFLLTAAIFLTLSGLLLLVAYFGLRRSLDPFERSRTELQQNVRWLKTALRNMGTRGVPRC